MANQQITASKLYDYLKCPHRVWRDIYGPQEEKSKEVNPFVELLWTNGLSHEEKVINKLGNYLDVSKGTYEERFAKTIALMKGGADLIYQGVLIHENLMGIPDILKKLKNGLYIPIDIKSGMAFEGGDEETGDEGKQKKHYTVQLCLYAETLIRLGFAKEKRGKIIDSSGEEVEYDLISKIGPRTKETWWEFYERIKKEVEFLMKDLNKNKPALSGKCKLCPWHDSCKKWCEEKNDLSRVFYLGRSVRDVLNDDLNIDKVDELLDLKAEDILKEKKKDPASCKGLGEKLIEKFVRRANILVKTKEPVIYKKIEFPNVEYELFFDIEDDPTQEFVYMHGIYERKGEKERYVDFTAKEISKEAEKEAWKTFWDYIDALPKDNYSVYYYSHHEKTTYKKLQKKYPEVISEEKVEEFFSNPNVIDLYQLVSKHTDWPLGSYSLKAIATFLGFKWRDETPSGALSIQWFNEYIKTKDEKTLKRILLYNEDDCRATMVLKDKIEKLQSN